MATLFESVEAVTGRRIDVATAERCVQRLGGVAGVGTCINFHLPLTCEQSSISLSVAHAPHYCVTLLTRQPPPPRAINAGATPANASAHTQSNCTLDDVAPVRTHNATTAAAAEEKDDELSHSVRTAFIL